MAIYHKWQPITELESAPEELADDGFRTMLAVWQEQKGEIDPEALRLFDERQRREWSVETGLIERVYTFDRGITETLIERGIDAAFIPHHPGQLPEKTAAIIQDHKNVVDGLFDFVKGDRTITTSYIKELHAALVQNQDTTIGVDQFGNKTEVPLIKGKYKTRPNNPTRDDGEGTHEYCPPEQTASEMDRLIEINDKYTNEGIAPEVQAAWLHHRFTQIHPFQDGNGRVARCLATLIFLRANGFPLIIRGANGEWERYIEALEIADDIGLGALKSVFVASQRRQFAGAISASRDIWVDNWQKNEATHQERTKQIAESAAQFIVARNAKSKKWTVARNIAMQMCDMSYNALAQTREILHNAVSPMAYNAFNVDCHKEDINRHAHKSGSPSSGGELPNLNDVVASTSQKLGYAAHPEAYHSWARLTLHLEKECGDIVFSFHGVKSKHDGFVFCSAFYLYNRDASKLKPLPKVLTDNAFQITYMDKVGDIQRKFVPWMESAIERGLACWYKSLQSGAAN